MPTADVTDHADGFANSFTNNNDRKRGT